MFQFRHSTIRCVAHLCAYGTVRSALGANDVRCETRSTFFLSLDEQEVPEDIIRLAHASRNCGSHNNSLALLVCLLRLCSGNHNSFKRHV
jgi:hypothetical protein